MTGPGFRGGDLGGILGVSQPRTSQLVVRLAIYGMATTAGVGRRRLALTDEALALLARRDRTAVGMARKRWSAAKLDERSPFVWRNVRGSRSRQLFRNLEHTQAVHRFVAALAKQARVTGWEVQQLDPPPRASRVLSVRERRSLHTSRRFRGLEKGRRCPALLPGVGAQGGQTCDDGRQARAIPAVLLDPPPDRRSRCATIGPESSCGTTSR